MTPVLLAIHAILIAQAAGPCEAAKASPALGIVQGRVVSKAEMPRFGVRVRGTIAGSGREVTTVSDRDGHYTLTGLDVGADVELAYRDPSDRITAGCWVRIARDTPTRSVDVVLDDFRAEEVTPSVGCQDVSPNDSWVTVGDRLRLVVGDIDTLRPAPVTTQPVPRLDLRATDIELAHFAADGVYVRLAPAARRALSAFTEANLGRVCVITIEGLVASARATIQGANTSGFMSVGPPALRGRLCEILERAPHPKAEPPPLGGESP